jgi:hypothetical protein
VPDWSTCSRLIKLQYNDLQPPAVLEVLNLNFDANFTNISENMVHLGVLSKKKWYEHLKQYTPKLKGILIDCSKKQTVWTQDRVLEFLDLAVKLDLSALIIPYFERFVPQEDFGNEIATTHCRTMLPVKKNILPSCICKLFKVALPKKASKKRH